MKEKSLHRSGENLTLRALYLLAIVFVVDGHTMLSHMFDFGRLFRYYSFHLMLFAFGAGYFFRMRKGIFADIADRAKRLLLPLYACGGSDVGNDEGTDTAASVDTTSAEEEKIETLEVRDLGGKKMNVLLRTEWDYEFIVEEENGEEYGGKGLDITEDCH